MNDSRSAVRELLIFVAASCLAFAMVRYIVSDLPRQVAVQICVVLAAIFLIGRNRNSPRRIVAVVIVSVIAIEFVARLAPRGAMPLRYLF
jgi:hypothetical protein